MESSFEHRINSLLRDILDTHVDLLAVMLAEANVDADSARSRLAGLVHACRSPIMEKTIFDGGRRMAVAVSPDTPPRLRFNEELLTRVGDQEIMSALSGPIAQLLGLTPVGVALLFHPTAEGFVRDLTNKAARRVEGPLVRPIEVSAYLDYRAQTLVERLRRTGRFLNRTFDVGLYGLEEYRSQMSAMRSWPEWLDVSSLELCSEAVKAVDAALVDTPWARSGEVIVELLWDSLALGPQSFLRHAGRTIRGLGGSLEHVRELLLAMARAVAGDATFSTDLADWPAYADVFDAWADLVRHERAMFGPVLLSDKAPPASVIDPAAVAFGLDEPRELPWDAPLVAWTVREQNALRDLLKGFIQTLPGYTEGALEGHPNLYLADERPLEVVGERAPMGIQVIALNADAVLGVPASFSRAWTACVHRAQEQFDALDANTQVTVNQQLRRAFDELFPEASPIWSRRFYDLEAHDAGGQFRELITAPNRLFRTPALFDPFHDPARQDLAPYPTLVFPVGVPGGQKIPFWVPVVALTSTMNGSPLRVRVVNVPAESSARCRWVCDRGLHLNKLAQQAVELLMRAVRGDALQMAVYPQQ